FIEFVSILTQAMYIRVKRSKTTYFLQCDATEKILDIKNKLQDLIDQPVYDQRLILIATGEVLDDSKTLADQKVENDAVVALTLRKGSTLNFRMGVHMPALRQITGSADLLYRRAAV
ncbi:hypothetical protein RJ640_016183, partial [Escallonia rubra]